jgi:hypothetical protein
MMERKTRLPAPAPPPKMRRMPGANTKFAKSAIGRFGLAAAILALLPGAVAPNAINTPGDKLGDPPETADFIKPGFQADFKTVPKFTHEHGRRAIHPLNDPSFRWSAGYVHAAPARTLPPYVKPGLPYPGFSWLHEESVPYPNADAMDAGKYSPFSIADGALRITEDHTPESMRALLPDGYPTEYISGGMTTYPYAQTYGYFELTGRVPKGHGYWPAFWLLPIDLSWPPEVDVMEVLGNDPTKLYTTVHSKALPGTTYLAYATKGVDLSEGFHRFGMDWGPEKIRFYLDRKLVFTEPTPADMHKPFYMVANFGLGAPKSWPGPPNDATKFPAHFDIQHIAAWQRRAYAADPTTYPPIAK